MTLIKKPIYRMVFTFLVLLIAMNIVCTLPVDAKSYLWDVTDGAFLLDGKQYNEVLRFPSLLMGAGIKGKYVTAEFVDYLEISGDVAPENYRIVVGVFDGNDQAIDSFLLAIGETGTTCKIPNRLLEYHKIKIYSPCDAAVYVKLSASSSN